MTRVEQVMHALGLKEIVARAGRAWALCPFHKDHEATNFFVRTKGEHEGQYHCFACQAGGDLVSLVVHVKEFGTRGAAKEWLAKRYKEPAPPPPAAVRLEEATVMTKHFEMPLGFVHEPLEAWPTPIAEYAISRGLTAEQVARWGIGYALEGRLSGRVVIPVAARNGHARSYMARTFSESLKVTRRYLYPDTKEHPDLDVLFGEQYWPADPSKETVVLTEGALKSLAVERAGYLYHGALGGSGLRLMHALKLARFGWVVILTDSDKAGDSVRCELHTALARHARVVHARLEQGKDADSVSREVLVACLTGSLTRYSARLSKPDMLKRP